jgi:exopolysaccharide production protein ExoZ
MLRGIAAAMVVVVHIGLQLDRLGYGTYSVGWLSSGVDIFFVISGFIMWVSVERRSSMTAAQFMRARLIRIVPLYWLVSGFVLATCLIAPQLLHTTVLEWKHALASFLFLPARHPVMTHEFWPLLIPGWTLNYEMLFYVLFAVAIAGSGGSARTRLGLIASLITGTVLVAFLLKGRIDAMHFYANPILFEFLAGIAVGILYMSGSMPKSWAWLIPVVIGFVMLRYGPGVVYGFNGTNLIAAAMIVSGALFLPAIPLPGLKAVGDASYSLYLTHVITLAMLSHFWALGLTRLGPVAFTLAGLALSIAAALICYRVFERPMTDALKRLWVPAKRQIPVG